MPTPCRPLRLQANEAPPVRPATLQAAMRREKLLRAHPAETGRLLSPRLPARRRSVGAKVRVLVDLQAWAGARESVRTSRQAAYPHQLLDDTCPRTVHPALQRDAGEIPHVL